MNLDNIYAEFHQQLYRFILKKVGNEDDAKDLLRNLLFESPLPLGVG